MEKKLITYEDVTSNNEIRIYISQADKVLAAMGYTEHSFGHVKKVAELAQTILATLGYSEREQELARIAGYMHDIGNVINRIDHAQSGAVMAFRILDKMGMDPEEIAKVISAIGNHDESTAAEVNPISAALILADKTDVRRSRVRHRNIATFDIHDKVNYAVVDSKTYFSADNKMLTLDLSIDIEISAVIDYFEIFLNRMILCRKAANYLNLEFGLIINGQKMV